MLPVLAVVAAAVVAAIVLLFQGVALWFAREMPRLDPEPTSSTPVPGPTVSVVIAARDEETDLPATLDGVLAQDAGGLEVVVVEGGSHDRTKEVIEARSPRVRRVEEPPLPPGWVGKNWACWTGAKATSGDWLLFLDADVRLHPSAVRTALDWSQREGAVLVTIAPRLEMVSFWERTVLPFYVQMVLTYFRAPHVNRARSRAAMANGQFWLVRRRDYADLGGHEAVRGEIVEDVAIAERYRTAGRTIRLAWAPELATTRMYRDRRELFEGVLRAVHGTRYSPARQAGFALALVALFWAPLALLPFGLAVGSASLAAIGAALYVALFGKHVAFGRAVGAPAVYGLLYPVAVGVYVAALAVSSVRGRRGGAVTWKRRAYPSDAGRGP